MDATEMKAAMVVPAKPQPALSPMGRALVEATMPFRLFQRAVDKLEDTLDATLPPKKVWDAKAKKWQVAPTDPDVTNQRLAAEHITRIGGMVTDRVEHDLQGVVAFTMLGIDRERV